MAKKDIWEYRRIVGLIRKRVDESACTTVEIIEYMRSVHNHDTRPNELEKALMKCERIHRIKGINYKGRKVSLWGSDWN